MEVSILLKMEQRDYSFYRQVQRPLSTPFHSFLFTLWLLLYGIYETFYMCVTLYLLFHQLYKWRRQFLGVEKTITEHNSGQKKDLAYFPRAKEKQKYDSVDMHKILNKACNCGVKFCCIEFINEGAANG